MGLTLLTRFDSILKCADILSLAIGLACESGITELRERFRAFCRKSDGRSVRNVAQQFFAILNCEFKLDF